ncbi:MAG: hypothetical protein ACM3ZC_03560 [Bacteroidota bacterium]
MSIWVVLGVVCMAGCVGGLMNALISDNGFLLPRAEEYQHGYIIRPGALGNLISGAVAAGVSWGLYGPLSAGLVLGPQAVASQGASLTLSSLVGAVLVGIGGARWLTNEVDKKLLRAAASGAAGAPSTPGAAQAMLTMPPAQVLGLARNLGSGKQ